MPQRSCAGVPVVGQELDGLNDDVFGAFTAALVADAPSAGRDARLHNQARAFSLHQACYELRILCSYTAHGQPVDFLFVERGRRLSAFRLRAGLDQAVTAAALTGRAGQPLRVTPHQLRHTYGTTLVNAGMSLQALMALMGHVSAEMTLRYASLASPTVRAAYEAAMNKVHARQSLFVITKGRPTAPDRVEWLRSEMLKTRIAHGYCSRDLIAEACPYANICEQCDNYVPAPEFQSTLETQLADIVTLRDDAQGRAWESEIARHNRVITSIDGHLRRLQNQPPG